MKSEQNLDEVLKKSTEGALLRIVSILGPQSSGKSTLLNGIFDSNFTVMSRHSRQQTTRGIEQPASFFSSLIFGLNFSPS